MPDESFTSKCLNTAAAALANPAISGSNNTATVKPAVTGSYVYRVTAFNGGETTGSADHYHFAQGKSVSVGFDLISGATNYRLYRSNTSGGNFFLVANGTGQPLVDDGSISGSFINDQDTSSFTVRTLGTLKGDYYTVPAATRTLLKEILVNNNSESAKTFSVYLVPENESAGIGNAIIYNDSLDTLETKIWSLNTVLPAGTKIVGNCDDIGLKSGWGSVSFRVSGIEIQ